MAVLKIQYNKKEFLFMNRLRDMFPELKAQTMGFVGAESAKVLKKKFLSGQEINLKKYTKDKKGKRTVSYSIGRGAKYVKIASYVLNLFEKGRMLRSGEREAGKKVYPKLKQAVDGKLGSVLSEFDSKYLQRKINKF